MLNRAQEKGVGWLFEDYVTNGDLQRMLFGELAFLPLHKRPDYERIHREMAKSGMTLSLLWNEYRC